MPSKILLADKSITIQKVVEMLFSGREYEVVCVSDGEAALHEAERIAPGVILADVDLPRVDGYSLAMRLKKTPNTVHTPVILMMSRDDVYDNAKGKQTGIVDKIVKPFESQELIGKVKKALALVPARPAESASTAAPSHPTVKSPPPTSQSRVMPTPLPPTDIFDIISDAPTHAEIKQTTAFTEEESFYEVEPVVEEVKAPLAREEEKALPTGAKAVEEIRAGLGLSLSETSEEIKPEMVTFESFDTSPEAALPKPEKTMPRPRHVGESVQLPVLPVEEMKKMIAEAVSKIAADKFKDIVPPPPPKISDETIKREIQEAVTKVTRELAHGIIEQVAWEVIPQLAEHLIKEEIERLKAEAH